MRTYQLLLLVLAGFGFFLQEAPGEEPEAGRVSRLIAQLGSQQFAEREAATQALDALGPVSLKALQIAARSEDMEVRRRAEDLLRRIDRRLETARLLAPKRVHLVYKDTPLTEAVDDFARKTGYTIQLDGDRTKLLGRKITLDTGDTTFWEALAQFCEHARLVEHRPEPAHPMNPYTNRSGPAGGTRIIDLRNVASNPTDNQIHLIDGKPAALPTYQSGALRLRALPVNLSVASQPRGDRDLLCTLEVTPEPGLQWQTVLGMRIDEAVDDKGQSLVQASSYVGGSLETPPTTEDFVVIVDGESPLPVSVTRHIPVRLRPGKELPKQIKELKGVLSAQVQTPPEALITVDNILKAAGQTLQTADGTTLKVISVSKEEVQTHVRVAVTTPPRDTGAGRLAGRIIRVNRGGIRARMAQLPSEGGTPILNLLDDKGLGFRLASCDYESGGNGATREFLLTYVPQKEQGEPAKLVFTGRRTAIIEVPFTFKDVPLP